MNYTDIDQSKILQKILASQTADLEYCLEHWIDPETNEYMEDFYKIPVIKIDDQEVDEPTLITLPCWSFTQLVKLLPVTLEYKGMFIRLRMDKSEKDFAFWYDDILSGISTDIDAQSENPVKAAYEMIIKLHDLKLL